jgi:hypothetical protein
MKLTLVPVIVTPDAYGVASTTDALSAKANAATKAANRFRYIDLSPIKPERRRLVNNRILQPHTASSSFTIQRLAARLKN